MREYSTIQKLVSAILICILIIGITPATLFHNILSDHVDKNIQHRHLDETEIANAGFNCHIEGFVADKNFSVTYVSLNFKSIINSSDFIIKPTPDFYSLHHFYTELRGPPHIV